MSNVIHHIQITYLLSKIVLIGSIGARYLNYISYDTFIYILIGVNLVLLFKMYDELEAYLIVRIIDKANSMNVDVTRLLYEMHMNDTEFGGMITKYIFELPIMLFFAYHGFIYTTIVWAYLLAVDIIIRNKTLKILTTKTIVDNPVDEE